MVDSILIEGFFCLPPPFVKGEWVFPFKTLSLEEAKLEI